MKTTTITLLLIIAFTLLGNAGLKKQEQAECKDWQAQSKNNHLFYYTDWQAMQCGINKIAKK